MSVLELLLDLGVAYGLDRLTAAWVNFTFAFALVTLLLDLSWLRRVRVQLETFQTMLSSTDIQRRRPSTVQQISRLLDDRQLPLVKRAWQTYLSDVQQAAREGEPLPEFSPYFSEDHMIGIPAHRAVAVTIPGTLVAVGILGTFVGLVIGLNRLDLAVDDIRPGIQVLVEGMGVAFYSSLAGIAMSISWTLVDRVSLRSTYATLLRTHDALRAVLPLASETHLLHRLARSVEDQTLTIKSLAEETIIPELVTGLDRVAESFRKAVDEALEPHIRRSQEAIEKLVDAATEGQLERIEEMAGAFVSQLDATMQGRLSELAAVLGDVIEWQKVVKQEVSDLIHDIREAGEVNLRSLEAVKGTAEDVSQAAQTLKDAGEGLSGVVEGITEAAGALSRLHDQNAKLAEELSRLQSDVIRSQQQALEELNSLTESFASLWVEAREDIERLHQALDQGTRTFIDNLHSGLDRTFAAFDEELSRAVQHLGTGISGLEDMVNDLATKLELLQSTLVQGIRELRRAVRELRPEEPDVSGADPNEQQKDHAANG